MTPLTLTPITEDLKQGTTKTGRKYSVRNSRSRYFYPNEWITFFRALKKENQPLFEFLIQTGARIDEALHIRPQDFDFDRSNVRLWKTKTKAAKGETIGKPRILSLGTEYSARVKKLCSNIPPGEYIFKITSQGAWGLLRRKLKKLQFKDWYNFSLHNIRKTHGMWLKAIGIDAGEICLRLGHDMNTYLSHYGSSDVFTEKDVRQIEGILGDLYQRRRRY